MTVQAGIEWDLLEQEMPAIPCEDPAHELWNPNGGPATHMYRGKCPACLTRGNLKAICDGLVKDLRSGEVLFGCNCGLEGPGSYFVEILTPITTRN